MAKAPCAVAALNEQSPVTIEVRFLGGLTDMQKNALKAAVDRWSSVIIGDLPSVTVDGEVIDDVLILAQGQVHGWPLLSAALTACNSLCGSVCHHVERVASRFILSTSM